MFLAALGSAYVVEQLIYKYMCNLRKDLKQKVDNIENFGFLQNNGKTTKPTDYFHPNYNYDEQDFRHQIRRSKSIDDFITELNAKERVLAKKEGKDEVEKVTFSVDPSLCERPCYWSSSSNKMAPLTKLVIQKDIRELKGKFCSKDINKSVLCKLLITNPKKNNIVPLIKMINSSFIVKGLEYQVIEKRTLAVIETGVSTLRNMLNEESNLTCTTVRYVTESLVAAIGVLHQHGWMHTNICPENIIITAAGQVKLAGLQYARRVCDYDGMTYESPIGFENYHSIEMAFGFGYNRMTDWFSLGIVIYEMYKGRLPWEDRQEMLNRTLYNGSGLKFERRSFTINAEWLIRLLLLRSMKKRLGFGGVKDVQSHKYFCSTNWDKIEEGIHTPSAQCIRYGSNELNKLLDKNSNKKEY